MKHLQISPSQRRRSDEEVHREKSQVEGREGGATRNASSYTDSYVSHYFIGLVNRNSLSFQHLAVEVMELMKKKVFDSVVIYFLRHPSPNSCCSNCEFSFRSLLVMLAVRNCSAKSCSFCAVAEKR